MILGVILLCNLEGQCMPVANTQELYENMHECELEGGTVIQQLPPHLSGRLYCYETNFFQEL